MLPTEAERVDSTLAEWWAPRRRFWIVGSAMSVRIDGLSIHSGRDRIGPRRLLVNIGRWLTDFGPWSIDAAPVLVDKGPLFQSIEALLKWIGALFVGNGRLLTLKWAFAGGIRAVFAGGWAVGSRAGFQPDTMGAAERSGLDPAQGHIVW